MLAAVLPQSMLVIVINKGNKKEMSFQSDIKPWLGDWARFISIL